MHADTGRRYRAYPTPGQAGRLTGWGHSCRAVWNLALERRRFAWSQRARTVRSAEQCRHLTDARADLPWLADLPAQSAQQMLRQLDRAYDNWWNPAFISDEREPRLMPSRLTTGQRQRLLGLEGRKARQVTWAKKHHRGRYSNRLRRTITEIARLRARQVRRRQDFTHKLTTDLTKNHGWVAEEPGRNVKAKAGLNRAVLDNVPYERQRQLAYKAPRFGSELRLVRPAFTSQTCSACGLRDPESRPGCGRRSACIACGHVEHADLNAARNIHNPCRRASGPQHAQSPSGGEASEPDA
jgi:IS605 OrfB family transposase